MKTRSFELMVIVVSLLCLVAFSIPSATRVLDDAYITFRFADHLRAGDGLVWNSGGQRTEGFSSLLHVVLCAVGLVVGWDPLALTRVLSIASLFGCAIICRKWLAELKIEPSWVAALSWLLFLGNGLLVYASLFGLETVIFTFLLTVTAYVWWRWCISRSRALLAVFHVLAALAVMCRPETPVWFAALFAVQLLTPTSRGPSRRAVATVTALVLSTSIGLLLAKFLYFEGRLPNPFLVKQSHGLVSPDGVRYLASYVFWALPLVLGAVRVMFAKAQHHLLPIGAASVAFALIFVRFDPLMGTAFRFLLPVWPLLTVLGVLGAAEWGQDGRVWTRPIRLRVVAITGASWILIWGASSYAHIARTLSDITSRDYGVIGTALREAQIVPKPTIVMGDQGALPYFSGWNSVDFIGLTTNEVARFSDSSTIANFVLLGRPEVIVIRNKADGMRPFITHARTPDLGRHIAEHQIFRDEYVLSGAIPDEDGNRISFYVNRKASKATQIADALARGIGAVNALESPPQAPGNHSGRSH